MDLEHFGNRFSQWFERTMPDPFTLALLLTLFVFLMGSLFGERIEPSGDLLDRILELAGAWKAYLYEPRGADGKVIQGYLYFGFQMCVMLVTGFAFATSPVIERSVQRAAGLPNRAQSAVAWVAFLACLAALMHWALGLIVGAMMAREVGRSCRERNISVHYPLLGAAGYTGLMVWGGGLSGSIPLKALSYSAPSTVADVFPFSGGIPESETLFSTMNGVLCLCFLVFVPWIVSRLHPTNVDVLRPYRGEGESLSAPVAAESATNLGWMKRLERGRGLNLLVGLSGLALLAHEWVSGEFKLTFNQINVLFLFAGLSLHRSVGEYVSAISAGVRGCAGILLQFPFYFGIIGILLVSGLGSQISQMLVSWTTSETYPLATFFSSGFLNILVPSGGGQWLVQKDIVIEGALHLQANLGKTIMAMAYGDAWTNMLQPFWALPLLGITGLEARHIVGYTVVVMLATGALICTVLWLF